MRREGAGLNWRVFFLRWVWGQGGFFWGVGWCEGFLG